MGMLKYQVFFFFYSLLAGFAVTSITVHEVRMGMRGQGDVH